MTAPDLWGRLQPLTPARIGLPRSGASVGTPALLAFRLDHARARDAVGTALDTDALHQELLPAGLPVLVGHSAAVDRRTYLMRPDLGRRLDEATHVRLAVQAGAFDVAVVVADGLSARAAQSHAAPLLSALLPVLAAARWRVAPLVLLHQGRVAAGDAVAMALGARSVLVLIGERPGLSSPDSLGANLTWAPGPATHDAERNCVSNIRPQGFAPADAARKIAWLLERMRAAGRSGVALKDDGVALPGSASGAAIGPAQAG